MSEQSALNDAWEAIHAVWHMPGVDPAIASALHPVLVALAPYRDRNQLRRDARTVFQWRDFYEDACISMRRVELE